MIFSMTGSLFVLNKLPISENFADKEKGLVGTFSEYYVYINVKIGEL